MIKCFNFVSGCLGMKLLTVALSSSTHTHIWTHTQIHTHTHMLNSTKYTMIGLGMSIHRIHKNGRCVEEVWGELSATWSRGILGY